ncbi:hypothetical protein Y10_20580 [Neptunitalea sp. Y10]|uniref:Mucoidy inhibitor MuiA family protein n=2 Tax=Neptunitalea lumnitzerae TaxID=2965509 RepID=A0ABQ5MJX1_9FLAO|nr:hypothetical protein Y10_20580 [Neptunitalea sp. Y10]
MWSQHTAKETESTITNATIYLSGAQIERTSTILTTKGETSFEFTNLSPFIDENSIQISGLKSATISAMNFTTTHVFNKKDSKRITELTALMKEKEHNIALINNNLKGLVEEENLLNNNRKLLSSENSSLEKLQEMATYYRERMTKIANETYNYATQKDSLQEIVNTYEKELTQLSSKNKDVKGVLTLKINSDKTESIAIHIKYNVSNAGWFPVYDIKTNSTESDLDIFFKAHVYQDTGEDWENVKVTLSTADPTVPTEQPEMNPHYLNFISRYTYNETKAKGNSATKYNPFIKEVFGVITDADGLPLPGATVLIEGTNQGTTTDFDGRYNLPVTHGENLTVSYVGFKTQTTPIYGPLINMTMEMDANQLEEVVIAGYGTNRDKSVTKALTGSVAGVSIREFGSVNNTVEPLYVIDGEIADKSTFENISQNNIASINVLKGADASAIYGARTAEGVVVLTTKNVITDQNITSVEYKIKQPQHIKSIMEISVIDIEKMEVSADYEYVAAPVLDENVYLTATLTNWKDLKLLPGQCNIYFSGVYVGKSYLNPYETKENLTLSLGVAPSITVKRTLDTNFKSTPFIGNNRIVNRAYTIALHNTGSKPVTVKLKDRIPVSENKEIKVNDITYDADNYTEEKGLLEWTIPINAGERTEKHLSYEIRYPKEKKVNLN